MELIITIDWPTLAVTVNGLEYNQHLKQIFETRPDRMPDTPGKLRIDELLFVIENAIATIEIKPYRTDQFNSVGGIEIDETKCNLFVGIP